MGASANFGIIGAVEQRSQLLAELGDLLVQSLNLNKPNPPIGPDEPLFRGRLALDSVDAAQWVAAIERRYAVEITDSELIGGALESLGTVADVLIRRGINASSALT